METINAKQSKCLYDILKQKDFDFYRTAIIIYALFSYGRVYLIEDVFWDDNAWLLSVYASKDIVDYLNTGWFELRRVPLGVFTYYLFHLHKSSNLFYIVGHTVNIITQVLTPLFLYLFLKNLFSNRQLLSFFIAVSLIILPLDYTLPVFVNTNYRIGILLTIISFYFTERALAGEKIYPPFMLMAFVTAGLAYYILIEATVAFEITRLFIIGYIFYRKGVTNNRMLIKKSLQYWALFILSCIPLVIYKLLFKPYGIYEGVYKSDFLFLFNWKEHAKIVKWFLLDQWKILLEYINAVSWESVLLSILSVVISIVAFKKIFNAPPHEVKFGVSPMYTFKEIYKNVVYPIGGVLLVGVFFLLPPIFILEFAGRELNYTVNSYHFALLQPGYAIMLGTLLYVFYGIFSSLEIGRKPLHFVMAFIIGAGIFFNNLNLDVYFKSWERQMHFWKTFTDRFPALPKHATVMMDVRDFFYYDFTDLDNAYDLEYMINLLYATSENPAEFRQYRVFAMEEFRPSMAEEIKCEQFTEEKLERGTHFGKEILEPCKFIIVHYRNGELLVNHEISEKYPDVPYKNWLKKGFPELPPSVIYPLRRKLMTFS